MAKDLFDTMSSEELKRRIEKSLSGAGNFGRGGWLKLVMGDNSVRPLSVHRDMFVHYISAEVDEEIVRKKFICPGKGCPLCIIAEKAIEEEKPKKAAKYSRKARYIWMVVDATDDENADGSLKIKLLEFGPQVLKGISIVQEDLPRPVFDLEDGYIIVIKKIKTGARSQDIDYHVTLGEQVSIEKGMIGETTVPDLDSVCAPTPIADIKEFLLSTKRGE